MIISVIFHFTPQEPQFLRQSIKQVRYYLGYISLPWISNVEKWSSIVSALIPNSLRLRILAWKKQKTNKFFLTNFFWTNFFRTKFFGTNFWGTSYGVTKLFWTKVPSMWFWSVSWSTNCPVFFSFFLFDQKKIVQSQGIFGQSLRIFGRPNFFQAYQNFFWSTKFFFWLTKNSQRLTKNSLRLDNLFLVDQKKREKDRTIGRPRDWPKTTWTGLLNAVKFLGWLKNFGQAQYILGPEKGEGITYLLELCCNLLLQQHRFCPHS